MGFSAFSEVAHGIVQILEVPYEILCIIGSSSWDFVHYSILCIFGSSSWDFVHFWKF
jgi:hypothetical protein